MKTCAWCGEPRPLTEYHKDKSTRDGRRNACKACVQKRSREYYEANREHAKALVKKRADANREQMREYGRAHYAANRDRIIAKCKQFLAEHPGRYEATKKRWADNNPDLRKYIGRAYSHRRRAKLREAALVSNVTHEQWLQRKSVFGDRCVYCGAHESEKKLTADHVIPLSRGGPHILANLRPACINCNSQKHTKKPSEWKPRKRAA